jgi:hypothetical protein
MPDCCLFVSAVFARSAQSGLTVLGNISSIHTVSTVSTVSTRSVCLRTYPFGWLVFVRAKSELSLTICLLCGMRCGLVWTALRRSKLTWRRRMRTARRSVSDFEPSEHSPHLVAQHTDPPSVHCRVVCCWHIIPVPRCNGMHCLPCMQ